MYFSLSMRVCSLCKMLYFYFVHMIVALYRLLMLSYYKYPQVSGHFTYGVMALSAATFSFWSLLGPRILPAAFHQGNSVSLALQLACSVLVCYLTPLKSY